MSDRKKDRLLAEVTLGLDQPSPESTRNLELLTWLSDWCRLKSSYPSFTALTVKTTISGNIAAPGEIVENFGKNCKIAMPRKNLRAIEILSCEEEIVTHMFAIRLNCSNRFRGRNVITLYLEVMTWLEVWT